MIRDFKTTDTDAVVDVWRAATAVAHPFLTADFIESEADNLRNIYLVHAQTRVIEFNGLVSGFIAMIGTEIGGLFLDPKLHGRGLGRALVDDAAKQFDTLEVEVFEQNTVGRRFYDSYGFQQIGSSFHEATGETVLRLANTGKNTEAAA
ncbi:GNAT family N-acetyltransferase [Aliiroseovarius sp. S1339]|uniref:GNAT family N-acetyltransferase n=1 Tax=Aliiroseovarius sp. S1339 TaxID=2936990 RepID=UPI0020C0493B|nr:GNAT family N-acetyltransferase [Aliiroseovarius sp. S1339]MCK8464169.1 GNAT family N-acetyltransferase [Aliiroseovarius sp. S1339]